MSKFYNISELSKILNLINPSNKKPLNHVLRYWEKEFKQVKPKKINNRRYYSSKQVEILKLIKFLLKNKGMTINGVKKILNASNSNNLDEISNKTIRTDNLRNKINNITNIIKDLKKLK